MKQMAANDSMASQFFPPNFLLQMQQPLPHHHHPQQDHHGHGHGHHHHPQEHYLLPSPHPAHLNPFLQDFGGMSPPPLPMLVGSKRPPPSMYPDANIDRSSHHHHHELDVHHQQQQQQEEDGAASDDEDGGSAAVGGCGGEKKRRLSVEQVRTLEKNFELMNKLEPERKLQLARAVGLQPRQVAIWFQNRRARWKTKQLEKDYDALRRQFDGARAENDALLAHNNKLQAEIVVLKGSGGSRQEAASELINLNVKETEASCSENSSEINLGNSRPAAPPFETSPMHRGGTAIQFYASVGLPGAGAGLDVDQLLHSHSSSPAVAPLKMELGTGNDGGSGDTAATAANFGSLLCGAVDEPAQFWPWVDGHHQFH